MWKYKNIIFDDVVTKVEDGLNNWANICVDCVEKYNVPNSILDNGSWGVCGVLGCINEFDIIKDGIQIYYIDFSEGELIEID